MDLVLIFEGTRHVETTVLRANEHKASTREDCFNKIIRLAFIESLFPRVKRDQTRTVVRFQ